MITKRIRTATFTEQHPCGMFARTYTATFTTWEIISPTPAFYRNAPCIIIAVEWDADGRSQLFILNSGLRVPRCAVELTL